MALRTAIVDLAKPDQVICGEPLGFRPGERVVRLRPDAGAHIAAAHHRIFHDVAEPQEMTELVQAKSGEVFEIQTALIRGAWMTMAIRTGKLRGKLVKRQSHIVANLPAFSVF